MGRLMQLDRHYCSSSGKCRRFLKRLRRRTERRLGRYLLDHAPTRRFYKGYM